MCYCLQMIIFILFFGTISNRARATAAGGKSWTAGAAAANPPGLDNRRGLSQAVWLFIGLTAAAINSI